jgi:hypothetical protein
MWCGLLSHELAREGFIKLTPTFKSQDLDILGRQHSVSHEDTIRLLVREEKSARVNSRGPLWSAYQSEFMKEQRVQAIRTWREVIEQKIYNALKR